MKRYKRLYVVLAVLLAACIATFALSRYKAQKEQIQTSGETILSISADEVESLSWDYDGQTLSFHRDGAWSYDDDAAFPVDAEHPATSSGEVVVLEVTEVDADGQPCSFELVDDEVIAAEAYADFQEAAKDLYDFA